MEVAVEDDVLSQVRDRIRVGGDARGGIQGGEVGIQAEACLGVEAPYLGAVGRVLELFLVVDAGVPGRVAARAGLELSPESEDERAVDLCLPGELVGLLGGEVGCSRLGTGGIEPAGGVGERAGQGDACPSLWRRLRGEEQLLGEPQVRARIGDVDDLEPGAGAEELLNGERAVERLVPRAHPACEDTAHGQRGGEPTGIVLEQAGGDDPAERVAPGNRAARRPDQRAELVQSLDLVVKSVLDRPARRGVGRTRERVTVIEEPLTGRRVADIERRIRTARRHVTMAVESERAVPVGGNLNQVRRSVVANVPLNVETVPREAARDEPVPARANAMLNTAAQHARTTTRTRTLPLRTVTSSHCPGVTPPGRR